MRFVSFATVLGAALLPAVNARPACRPDTSATSGVSVTSVTTTTAAAVETSSTEAATTVDASTTYETTTDLETTIAISKTASSDSTVLIPATTAETTPAEITTTTAETTIPEIATTTAETTPAETTAAEIVTTTAETTIADIVTTTTAAAAGPTNFVENGSFEDNTSNAWDLQNSDIANNPASAHTGGQYLEFYINNDFAIGQDQASQTISGLSTDRQYGFSLYATIFSSPTPVRNPSTICLIQVQQGTTQISQFRVDLNNLDSYQPFSVNFTPVSSVISLSLKLRCTNGQRVTLALGIDDVVIGDII